MSDLGIFDTSDFTGISVQVFVNTSASCIRENRFGAANAA